MGFHEPKALDINGGTKEAPPQQHGSDQFVMTSETEKDFGWSLETVRCESKIESITGPLVRHNKFIKTHFFTTTTDKNNRIKYHFFWDKKD